MKSTSQLIHRFNRATRPTVATSTHRAYVTRLDLMRRAVPDDPARVARRHILDWLDTTRTAATRNAYLTAAVVFWQWCVDHDHVVVSPCRGIRRSKTPARRPRHLTAVEVGLVVRAAVEHSPAFGRAVSLMAQEGLRIGEVAAARWEDTDGVELVVRGKGYRGEPSRTLPLTKQTRRLLAPIMLRGPIVPNARGGHWMSDRLDTKINALIRATIGGVPNDGRTAHALRHTAATDMVNQGKPLRTVQRILGHESLATTERYVLGADADMRDAIEGRWYGPKDAA